MHTAKTSQGDNQTMLILTERMRRDSRVVKIVAFITMGYLPASLVAVQKDPSPFINGDS